MILPFRLLLDDRLKFLERTDPATVVRVTDEKIQMFVLFEQELIRVGQRQFDRFDGRTRPFERGKSRMAAERNPSIDDRSRKIELPFHRGRRRRVFERARRRSAFDRRSRIVRFEFIQFHSVRSNLFFDFRQIDRIGVSIAHLHRTPVVQRGALMTHEGQPRRNRRFLR